MTYKTLNYRQLMVQGTANLVMCCLLVYLMA